MIIGISGKLGSGKDLVGSMISFIGEVETPTYDKFFNMCIYNDVKFNKWTNKKFADALKDNVCNILGCTREQLEDREFKEKPLGEEWWYYDIKAKPTQLLPYGYYKGTDKVIADARFLIKPTPRLILQRLGTEGGRDVIHPNIWVNAAMAGYDSEKHLWYFTDVRFPNELQAVKDRGGITIRLQRGGGNTGNHPSETGLDNSLDKFDYVVDNDGTIEELYNKVYKIMQENNLLYENHTSSVSSS